MNRQLINRLIGRGMPRYPLGRRDVGLSIYMQREAVIKW